MLLKQRRKKLLRIFMIGFIVLGMVGISIPHHIFAAYNSISITSLEKGDILYPGDELMGFTGSMSYITYAVGSGKFADSVNNNPSNDCENFYVQGSRFGLIASEFTFMDYNDVVDKAMPDHPATPLHEGSVFFGWLRSNEFTYSEQIDVQPIIVSYDNGVVPSVQYDEENQEYYITPQNIPDKSLVHGDLKQKITKEMIDETGCAVSWNGNGNYCEVNPCHIVLTCPIYSESELDDAKNYALSHAAISKIADVNVGETINLEADAIQLEGVLSDLRYVPDSWSVDELGLSGRFEKADAQTRSVSDTYHSEILADTAGDYTVDVTWVGQILQNGEWQNLDASRNIMASADYKVIQETSPDEPEQPTTPTDPSQPEEPSVPEPPIADNNQDHGSNTVIEKPQSDQNNNLPEVKNPSDKMPQTQDHSSLLLPLLLCSGSLAAIIILAVYKRKKSS